MDKKRLIMFLFIFVFLTMGITSMAYKIHKNVDIQEFDTHVIVGDVLGVAVDAERFSFGQVTSIGGAAKKILVIDNSKDYDVYVNFEQSGDLKDYITVDPFILKKGESKEVSVGLNMPSGMEKGEYFGKLRVIITRA